MLLQVDSCTLRCHATAEIQTDEERMCQFYSSTAPRGGSPARDVVSIPKYSTHSLHNDRSFHPQLPFISDVRHILHRDLAKEINGMLSVHLAHLHRMASSSIPARRANGRTRGLNDSLDPRCGPAHWAEAFRTILVVGYRKDRSGMWVSFRSCHRPG